MSRTGTATPPGSLALVATPIGNLDDLTPRAVHALSEADLVCCEDTRRTGLLLQRAGVRAARLAVCNEHTEAARIDEVLAVLDAGGRVAVVSDAGTPGISDPGERLVRAALDAGHLVTTVPGPVAAIAALVSSGLPTDRFVFEGFVPRKGSERTQRLDEIAAEPRTIVLYEAPHRLLRTLADLERHCGPDRRVVVARELTKWHEEVVRDTVSAIDVGTPRGEYVVVVEGAARSDPSVVDDDRIRAELRDELADGASTRDAASAVANRLGVRRRTAYELAVALGRREQPRHDSDGGVERARMRTVASPEPDAGAP